MNEAYSALILVGFAILIFPSKVVSQAKKVLLICTFTLVAYSELPQLTNLTPSPNLSIIISDNSCLLLFQITPAGIQKLVQRKQPDFLVYCIGHNISL